LRRLWHAVIDGCQPGATAPLGRGSPTRSVRNAQERARLRHGNRLITADGTLGKDDLDALEPAGFPGQPRVFST